MTAAVPLVDSRGSNLRPRRTTAVLPFPSMLDLSSLRSAVSSPGLAVQTASAIRADPSASPALRDLARAGVIQNIEVTYELCWKMIVRLIEAIGDETPTSRRNLYRVAAQLGLIDDVDAWWGYHEARNESTHTYNGELAERIYGTAHRFEKDAIALCSAIADRSPRP